MANAAFTLRKQQEWYLSPESWCPCGKAQIPYEDRHHLKYCSSECRKKYAKPSKVKDPANWITFNCEWCSKEMTRPKHYGSGANRFCSNGCASRGNRAVQHLGVDGIVLDSGYEALFWGMCKFWKLTITCVSGEDVIDFGEGKSYAPDFMVGTMAVEVKGPEDEGDKERYGVWVAKHHELCVVRRDDLLDLLRSQGARDFLDRLYDCMVDVAGELLRVSISSVVKS
jgi:hypothetical protein